MEKMKIPANKQNTEQVMTKEELPKRTCCQN